MIAHAGESNSIGYIGTRFPLFSVVGHFDGINICTDGWKHEAEDAAAIGGLPPEELVRKFGGVVPGKLEGGERFDATLGG